MKEAKDYQLYRTMDGKVHCKVHLPNGEVRQLRHIVKHSPSGLEYGYLGSGPSDLALSILVDAYDVEFVPGEPIPHPVNKYMQFKSDIIAGIPKSGRIITHQDIERWVAEHPKEKTDE